MNRVDQFIDYIRHTHPDIVGNNPISLNYDGSVNIIAVVESSRPWVFRLSRIELPEAQFQMKRDQELWPKLKGIAPYIPQVEIIAEEPFQYMAYPKICGVKPFGPVFSKMSEVQIERLAAELSKFLTIIHNIDLREHFTKEEIQPSSQRARWGDFLNSIRTYVFPNLNNNQITWTLKLFNDFLLNDQLFLYTPCLVDGDLKLDHIFIDEHTYQLTGIVDMKFAMSDPAIDFSFIELDSGFRSLMLKHYGGIQDNAFLDRINFYEHSKLFCPLIHAVITNNQDLFQKVIVRLNHTIEMS